MAQQNALNNVASTLTVATNFKVSTGAVMTNSSQPAFTSNLGSSPTNVPTNGTPYTVIFDTVTFDNASNYNNGTGVFTAPATGIYYFSTSIFWQSVSTVIGYLAVGFNINGSLVDTIKLNSPNIVYTGGYADMSTSYIVKLTAAQTVSVQITAATGSGNAGILLGWFSGYLVA